MTRQHYECLSSVLTRRRARLVALGLAVVVMTLGVSIGAGHATTIWFDDFSDGNAEDGNPEAWVPHLALAGDYNATSGDYILTPGFGPDNNQSMIATVETATLANVSIRTRMFTSPGGGSGTLGVAGRFAGPLLRPRGSSTAM
jgi:hypothetical protein